MTDKTLKERLEQYVNIDGEISDLRRKKQQKVSGYFEEDEVYGCPDVFPYTKQKIRIDGYSIPDFLKRDLQEIDNQIQDLRNEKVELEDIVDRIPNLRTRRIIRQRYIYGEKLSDLPSILGHWESYDSVKWVIREFFKSTPKTPKTPESA